MPWRWLEDAAFDEAFKNFVDDEAREKEMDRREKLIVPISARLDEIYQSIEQEGFIRQARHEDGDYEDDPLEDLEDDEREAAVASMELQKQVRAAQQQAEIDTLEEQLAAYGARRARPYEHWNEEEGLMAYLERDR